MSEEALKQAFPEVEAEGIEEVEEVELQQEEAEPEPQEETVEDRARKRGWMPLDEWTEAGNDPNEWSGASRFLELGRLIHENKGLARQINDVEGRIERVTRYQEAQFKSKLEKIQEEKRAAVEVADVEQYERLSKEEEQIKGQASQPANQDAQFSQDAQFLNTLIQMPEMQSWMASNQDILNDPAKAAQFLPLVKSYGMQNPTHSLQQTLDYVTGQIKPPTPNPRRENAKTPEKGRRTTSPAPKKLRMSDLTKQELRFYDDFKSDMSQEQFLQMVADVRKGEQ